MRLVAFLVATTCLAAPAPGAETETARVSVVAAHLRKGPGLAQPILATLKAGTLLGVVGRQGDWVEVRVAGSDLAGFIYAPLVEVLPPAEAPPTGAPPTAPTPRPSPVVEPGVITGTVTMVAYGGRPAEDMSDTVVFLEGASGAVNPTTASMEMRGKEFIPHIVAVGAGSRVDFPNVDPILHNVFSPSSPNTFDLGLYMRPDRLGFVFRHAGIARIYCNIHPQMSAIVIVRDNPFFTKATRKGAFTLPGVPPGRYTLHAWHEEARKEASTAVVVPSGGTVTATLALDASTFEPTPHKRKDGKDYAPEAYRK